MNKIKKLPPRLNDGHWKEIQTKYEIGNYSVNAIAKEYGITEGAIRARIKKYKWNQKLGKKLDDVKEKLMLISQDAATRDLNPRIMSEEFSEMLQMHKMVNSYIKGAVNLNYKNLQDTLKEPDPFKRIVMTNRMRATMPDLAGIAQNPVKLNNQDDPSNPENKDAIQIYLPDNNR